MREECKIRNMLSLRLFSRVKLYTMGYIDVSAYIRANNFVLERCNEE